MIGDENSCLDRFGAIDFWNFKVIWKFHLIEQLRHGLRTFEVGSNTRNPLFITGQTHSDCSGSHILNDLFVGHF